ncbi:DUF3426 domain-containing protein [Vogesella sp. LIG4]|uniref:DUF3426 domain-containing protein n=1 Tax=Vogesella sp. LIG4 TaxID=1192162 RepID=UPI00081F7C9C|nr:DUF3426 domain-containing protein [Vogesella sp. LIG4]SCK07326.1 MJ0042 family finger-like domain-containing protein [Vogesella sp. LIG4]
MSHTTQCPACQTKFKVTDAHLALAGGMVRCGRCNHVFHAPSHIAAEQEAPAAPAATPAQPVTPPAAHAAAAATPEDDDFELELPDFQPDAAAAPAEAEAAAEIPAPAASPLPAATMPEAAADFDLPDFDLLRQHDVATEAPADHSIGADFRAAAQDAEQSAEQGGHQQLAEFEQALAAALRPHKAGDTPQKPLASNPFDDTDSPAPLQAAVPSDWPAEDEDEHAPPLPAMVPEREQPLPPQDDTPGRPWWRTTLLALLAVVLLLLLLAQALFINRTRAAAELPELRPLLEAVCSHLGCKVPLPSDRQLIRTEWSELAFVPGQDKLIQLNATLKNLAAYPQNYPLMELTLKNGNDQVLLRKVLQPQQYLATSDFKLGQFNANSEVKIQLRMEVTEGKAQGYSLDFYYP